MRQCYNKNGGAPGRTRTCNRRIRSPMLYPLSHGRIRYRQPIVDRHYIASSGKFPSGSQIIIGADSHPIHFHLEMQMRAGRFARGTHGSDVLPTLYPIPHIDEDG